MVRVSIRVRFGVRFSVRVRVRPFSRSREVRFWTRPPFFFLGPDLLAEDHLLRHETGPGRPGPSKKNALTVTHKNI